ncbi:hypothetical protein [Nonomuraea sp. NPDC049480]|uniref:hypothetical protein n=1 Tax=Nonomuraea sp. NPDC049480 TaxID=3364353 RepID=UPI0037B28827
MRIVNGLLDELHIWLHPLPVGNRPPGDLISAVGTQARFRPADVRGYDSGLVILSYRSPDSPETRES